MSEFEPRTAEQFIADGYPQEIAELMEACGYDDESDTGVDSLIDYKNALEDAYVALLTVNRVLHHQNP